MDLRIANMLTTSTSVVSCSSDYSEVMMVLEYEKAC